MTTIETREQWGALPPKYNPGGFTSLEATVGHYTGSGATYMVPSSGDHERCRNQVRAIQRYHQSLDSQSDIEYNFLACNHDVLFQGRPEGMRGGANGTKASNMTMPSCCGLIGVGSTPEEGMLKAFRFFHSRVEAKAGRVLLMNRHKDIKATGCPGDWLSQWIADGGYKIQLPPPDPVVVSLGKPILSIFNRYTQSKSAVKALQGMINFWYGPINCGPVDGDFGNQTRDAVKLLQAELNRRGHNTGTPDGIYNWLEWTGNAKDFQSMGYTVKTVA